MSKINCQNKQTVAVGVAAIKSEQNEEKFTLSRCSKYCGISSTARLSQIHKQLHKSHNEPENGRNPLNIDDIIKRRYSGRAVRLKKIRSTTPDMSQNYSNGMS